MYRLLLLVLFSSWFDACGGSTPTPPAPPPVPTSTADAAPPPAPPPPPPAPKADAAPPSPPAPPSDQFQTACTNLTKLGCAEGKNKHCIDVLKHAVASTLTPVNVPCLEQASSKTTAAACGFVQCK